MRPSSASGSTNSRSRTSCSRIVAIRCGRDSGTAFADMRCRIRSRPVNPLFLPPKLLLRALDDLHAIALVAAQLTEVEERMNQRLDRLMELGERIADLGDGIDTRGAALLK